MSTSEETAAEETIPQVVIHGESQMRLPIEIIEQIALYLADHGSRSAVIAALIHPALTKSCTDRMFANSITAHIRKPSTLNRLIQSVSARGFPIFIDTLRIQPSTFCSLKQEDITTRVMNHLMKVEYSIEDLQLHLPNHKPLFDSEYSGKVFLPSVRSLTILHGPYPLEHLLVAFNVEEVTLVEPSCLSIYTLHHLSSLKVLYLFFIEDDETEEHDWWYTALRRYSLCCRRGMLDKLLPIKLLKAEIIYFVVMDGDPHPRCFVDAIGHIHHGTARHDFYRYWSGKNINDFQRIDAAKALIKQWEIDHSRR